MNFYMKVTKIFTVKSMKDLKEKLHVLHTLHGNLSCFVLPARATGVYMKIVVPLI